MGKLLFEEFKIVLRKEKNLSVFLILISIIGSLCFGATFYMLIKSDEQMMEYNNTYKDMQLYSIMDNFPDEYLQDANNTQKFRKFWECLNSDNRFKYYTMYDQPIYWDNYNGDERNINGYEHKSSIASMTQEIIDKKGIKHESTCLKGFWVGENVFDFFQIKLSEGRSFEHQDFILNESDSISIILGSNYRTQYHIGDRVYISFVFAEREAEIVGFIEEGTNVYYRDKFVNLDRYVIMPVFENDEFEGHGLFNFSANYFYVLRNSGLIATEYMKSDIDYIIQKYTEDIGLENKYYITGENQKEKNAFSHEMELLSFIICVISAITGIACFVINTLVVIKRVRGKRRYYAILMINGFSRLHISILLLFEHCMICTTSLLVTFLIFSVIMIFGNMLIIKIYGVIALWMLINLVFTTVISLKSLFNYNLIHYLNEGN